MSTYTISVYSYIDLPSIDYTVTLLIMQRYCEVTVSSSSSVSSFHSDSVIALGVSVGVLLILLTVSVIFNICCFIRIKVHFATGATIKDPKADKDIAMQVCEPYQIHKNEVVYAECQASPDATGTYDL
ncbi:PREDICTED: uncharacterized protein LOC109586167 [Amphimedon queenslandica]|uniref:Uncharacterized protein n=1 Tax=Amphimedon queenslandica TaxID=400682 RepID=A0AAN0JLN4_AMPQE|nr:PREDICTED: uncharacterized protein LOC109586167 [Amphimedon queenslandica]|eukprot:XP_019857901.1 PREDICTED: uncharacterized protein LOC109586167 [Amphimedon queenslandica]